MSGLVFLIALLVIIFLVLLSSIKVVNTGYLYVVERLGQFHRILEPGWHFVIPGVDFVRRKVSTKQQILDVPPQSVITKDNVKISVDNVIFYKMLNAKDAVYNIEDYKVFYIESDENNTYNEVKEYIGTKGHKEVVVVTSYDMEEDIPKFEKLGVKKIISEPVFNSDLRKLLSDKKNKARLKKDKNIFKGRKILIVEDNEINIDIISDYLDDVEIKYDSVRNGLDAYNRIKQNHSYDCVLMDIKMPVMDGYEATRKIRALDDEYVRKLPIIAMTANAFTEDKTKALKSGMDDYLTKPLESEKLIRALSRYKHN